MVFVEFVFIKKKLGDFPNKNICVCRLPVEVVVLSPVGFRLVAEP